MFQSDEGLIFGKQGHYDIELVWEFMPTVKAIQNIYGIYNAALIYRIHFDVLFTVGFKFTDALIRLL